MFDVSMGIAYAVNQAIHDRYLWKIDYIRYYELYFKSALAPFFRIKTDRYRYTNYNAAKPYRNVSSLQNQSIPFKYFD